MWEGHSKPREEQVQRPLLSAALACSRNSKGKASVAGAGTVIGTEGESVSVQEQGWGPRASGSLQVMVAWAGGGDGSRSGENWSDPGHMSEVELTDF